MEIMTLPEASKRYNIPYQTLRSAAREGRLKTTRSSATYLVTDEAIEAALEAGNMRRPGEKGKHHDITQ